MPKWYEYEETYNIESIGLLDVRILSKCYECMKKIPYKALNANTGWKNNEFVEVDLKCEKEILMSKLAEYLKKRPGKISARRRMWGVETLSLFKSSVVVQLGAVSQRSQRLLRS